MAPLRRRFAGAITPTIWWIHYADDVVAPLRRQSGGSITPTMKWLLYADDSHRDDELGDTVRYIRNTLEVLLLTAILSTFCLCFTYAIPDSKYGLTGWVQAVGSIGAIFVAIFVMSEQHRATARREQMAAFENQAALASGALGIAFQFKVALEKYTTDLTIGPIDYVKITHNLAMIKQISRSIDAIPAWQAYGQVCNCLLDLGRMCASLTEHSQAALSGAPIGLVNLKAALAAYYKEAGIIKKYLMAHTIHEASKQRPIS